MNKSQSNSRNLPVGGVILLLIGLLWLSTKLFDFPFEGKLILFGLAGLFLIWGIVARTSGLFIPGCILLSITAAGSLIDSGVLPEDTEGGFFLLILALGFASITLLSRLFTTSKSTWALIVAGILSLFGGFTMLLALPEAHILHQIAAQILDLSNYIWPLLLIALGVKIILEHSQADNDAESELE